MLKFSDNKAGMTGLDKEKIVKVIEENTSANYSSYTKKHQKKLDEKTADIKRVLDRASDLEKEQADFEMTILAETLEYQRDLSRHCTVIDMDAYFASVEMRDNPDLRSVPMAVGSSSMLSTSNYLARKFGVRAAMPGFIGKKLCPQLRIVDVNYQKYSAVSKEFADIFREYDDEMSMMSLDEAYIDITEVVETRTEPKKWDRFRYHGCICRLPLIPEEEIENCIKVEESLCSKCKKTRTTYRDEITFGLGRQEVVNEIRFRVEQRTGLTCSAGIAANFFLAKICADINKPNGQFDLKNEKSAIIEFLKDLPIRKVCGIGAVSEAQLKACEIETVGDMWSKKFVFPLVFSTLAQESFIRTALGLPGRCVESDSRRKSISVERTFKPTSSKDELFGILSEVCEMLMEDVKKAKVQGAKNVTLKLKTAAFQVLTRSFTCPQVVTTRDEIEKQARTLLKNELGTEMRLLGVKLAKLSFEGEKEVENKKRKQKMVSDYCVPKKIKDDSESGPSTSTVFTVPDTVIDTVSDTVPCPICSMSLPNDDRTINSHVDECLNAPLLEAPPIAPPLALPKKGQIDQFFHKSVK